MDAEGRILSCPQMLWLPAGPGTLDFNEPAGFVCEPGCLLLLVALLASDASLRLALNQITCSKSGALHLIGMKCNSFCQPLLACI